ncbi:hydrogenase/urease maturation nickel metallochaperone HypA [Salmonella enterica subsp. enterica serovar Corvallis]
MHELALAQNIIELLEEQAVNHQFSKVKQVWLEIGVMACVEVPALHFGLDVAARHTLAFYGTAMGKTFSKRTLKLDAPPAIHVYGNAAVAEFDWHFTAVRRDNGQTQHTTGRESQVWAKIPNTGWRIVHVHYSGPAKTGVGEGY